MEVQDLWLRPLDRVPGLGFEKGLGNVGQYPIIHVACRIQILSLAVVLRWGSHAACKDFSSNHKTSKSMEVFVGVAELKLEPGIHDQDQAHAGIRSKRVKVFPSSGPFKEEEPPPKPAR